MLKIKNILKIVACLFISFNSFSQKTPESGEVTYRIKMNPIQMFKSSQLSNKFQKIKTKIDNIIPNLTFTLKFNRGYSLFFMNPDLSLDGKEFSTEIAILAARGNSIFFVDANKKLILEEISRLEENVLIQSSTTDLKWKLINEKKMIGKYICYKAIAQRKNSGPLKKENKYSTYTAWYCPDITFNYGPYEFTGLPGLVLELSNDYRIYTASMIKLSQKKIKINKPTNGKLLTKEEFENRGKKAFENKDIINN